MNWKRKLSCSIAVAAVACAVLLTTTDTSATRGGEGGRGDGPIVYVTGQDLFYDSIVTADPIPVEGPFQLLEMGPMGLQTEYGPGDAGYVGGRWKEDFDGDGEFHYFMCPLLGPGRIAP
jgi:hypothetical protein